MPFWVEHGARIWPAALVLCLAAGVALTTRRGRMRSWPVVKGVMIGLSAWVVVFGVLPIGALYLPDVLGDEIAQDEATGLGVATPWPDDWRLAIAPFAAAGPLTRSRFLRDYSWTIPAPTDAARARQMGLSLAELGGRCDILVRHARALGDEARALELGADCDDVRTRSVIAAIQFGRGELRRASDAFASARWERLDTRWIRNRFPLQAARVHLAAGRGDRAIEALERLGTDPDARCVRDALLVKRGDAQARADLLAHAARTGGCALLAEEIATGGERERHARVAQSSGFIYASWLVAIGARAFDVPPPVQPPVRGTHTVLLDVFVASQGVPALEARALQALQDAPDTPAVRLARARIETELAVSAISSGREAEALQRVDRAIRLVQPLAGAGTDAGAYERAVALSAAMHARANEPRDADTLLAMLPETSFSRITTEEALRFLAAGASPSRVSTRESWNGARESVLWYAATTSRSAESFSVTLSRRVCPPAARGPMPHARCPSRDELPDDWATDGAGTRCELCPLGREVTERSFRAAVARVLGLTAEAARFTAERDRLRAAWLDPRFAVEVAVLEQTDHP